MALLIMSNSKLADWDDDDPQAMQETSSRWDKVVILKHLFTLKELEVRREFLAPPFALHLLMKFSLPHRKTRPRSLTSKKTFEKNAPRWAKSPMLSCSTRKPTV